MPRLEIDTVKLMYRIEKIQESMRPHLHSIAEISEVWADLAGLLLDLDAIEEEQAKFDLNEKSKSVTCDRNSGEDK